MLVRRLGVGALVASLAFCSTTIALDAAGGDKQLARVKGIVGYEPEPNAPFKAIFGRLDLPDNAVAVTQAGGQAVLRLADSSEIDIGEKTSVQVGAFNAVSSGRQNEIVLNGGVLHFNIRHPAGGQSNYKFTTATSQIAVRGTEGFLISNASGTQVVCVSCATGDVTISSAAGGGLPTSLVSGQTASISSSGVVSTSTSVTSSATSQFNSAGSSTTTSTGTAAAGGSTVASGAGGTLAVVGAGAAATGVVVASTTGSGNTGTATTNNPPATCGNGTIVAAFVIGGQDSAFATFPQTATLSAQQPNACGDAKFTLTATAAPSSILTGLALTSAVQAGVLTGTATGSVTGPGAVTVTLSANDGGSVGPVTFNVYGPVTSSQSSLSFTATGAGASQTLTLAQGGPATAYKIGTPTCATGASVSVSPTSGSFAANGTVTVTANSAPTTPQTNAACTITVTGTGTGAAASLSIPVNITTTSIGISNQLRSLPNVKRAPR